MVGLSHGRMNRGLSNCRNIHALAAVFLGKVKKEAAGLFALEADGSQAANCGSYAITRID